jgi:predicted DNA-binding transcriptional regulator AlpA
MIVSMNLVGLAEIAELLGVTRQRADVVVKSAEGFPEPVATLSAGRIWDRDAVERWIEERNVLMRSVTIHVPRGATPPAPEDVEQFYLRTGIEDAVMETRSPSGFVQTEAVQYKFSERSADFIDAAGELHVLTVTGDARTGTVWVPVSLTMSGFGLGWIVDELQLESSPGRPGENAIFRVPRTEWSKRIAPDGTSYTMGL